MGVWPDRRAVLDC